MEEKDQSLIPTFLVVLVLSFTVEAFHSYTLYLPHFYPSTSLELQISQLIALAAIPWIHPFLIFIAVYLVGRKINLKAKLAPLTALLIVGAYVGHVGGRALITLIKPEMLPGAVFAILISTSFLESFFAAFTALSIAYLRR